MSRKGSLVSGSFKHATDGASLNFIFLRINSVYELFKNVCEKNKDKIAYRYKDGTNWKPVTWGEHQETCKKISKSLMALGIEKGDKVNILSWTRLEWIQVDMATVSIGLKKEQVLRPALLPSCAEPGKS